MITPQQLLCALFIGIINTEETGAAQQGLRHVKFSYIASLTELYNGREVRQHENCNQANIESSSVIMCKEDSILSDSNIGDINLRDGLQNDEKQKCFIWNVNNVTPAPFISIDLEENVVPHSIEFYFLSSPQNSIHNPDIKLYWSSNSPINPQHDLPFQRMAYLIGNGKYKYRAILVNTNITPFIYVQMRSMQHITSDSWIYLSEMKVYTNSTKDHSSSVTTIQGYFTINQTSTQGHVTLVNQTVVETSTVNPSIVSTRNLSPTKISTMPVISQTIELSQFVKPSDLTQMNTASLNPTLTVSANQQSPSTTTLDILATPTPSLSGSSLSLKTKTETSATPTTYISFTTMGSSSEGFLLPTNSPTATNKSSTDDDRVLFQYPIDEEIVEVVITQQKSPSLLNCTIAGSGANFVNVLWTFNNQSLSTNATQLFDDLGVSYVYADKPGTYECKVKSSIGTISSRTFKVVMSDESKTPSSKEKEKLSFLVVSISVGISVIIILLICIIIVVTLIIFWKRSNNGRDKNVRTSTISTRAVKEDEMAYCNFLKASSLPPTSEMTETIKIKTISLDNKVSKTSLPDNADNDLVRFTFFNPYLEMQSIMGSTADENEIDLNIYEDISITASLENEFDEYVDMSFQASVNSNSDVRARPFSSIYAAPRPLKKHEAPSHITWDSVTVVARIGEGVFGEVFLAHISKKDTNTINNTNTTGYQNLTESAKAVEATTYQNAPTQVAIKVLKTSSLVDKVAFEKEIKFMSRLRNENVVKLLGVCSKGTPFIMMEYMENGDLQTYLQKHCYPTGKDCRNKIQIKINTITYILLQVSNGMKYLAAQKFIHRDLAARNCLVGRKYLIKIADFGMGQKMNDSNYYQYKGNAAVPVRWMPTESFYGKFSTKSDVWAFGVTMWEVFHLGKRQPYDNKGDQVVVADAMKGPARRLLPKPTHCPYTLYQLMLRCWVHEPQYRATFEELYQKLYELFAHI